MLMGCADRLDFNPTHLSLPCLLILICVTIDHETKFTIEPFYKQPFKSTRYFEKQTKEVAWKVDGAQEGAPDRGE